MAGAARGIGLPAQEVEGCDGWLGEGCLGDGADSRLQAIQWDRNGVLYLPAPHGISQGG